MVCFGGAVYDSRRVISIKDGPLPFILDTKRQPTSRLIDPENLHKHSDEQTLTSWILVAETLETFLETQRLLFLAQETSRTKP